MVRRILLSVSAVFILVLLGIQLVPHRVDNPPVRQEPEWDTVQTRALAKRACFDCHSNEVVVPWYGQVAPVAWLVRDHVDEGRAALNFSEMDRVQEEAHEAAETIREGEMPPWYYTPLHAEAQLTSSQWQQLADGLEATLGGEADGADHEAQVVHRHDDDDDDR